MKIILEWSIWVCPVSVSEGYSAPWVESEKRWGPKAANKGARGFRVHGLGLGKGDGCSGREKPAAKGLGKGRWGGLFLKFSGLEYFEE